MGKKEKEMDVESKAKELDSDIARLERRAQYLHSIMERKHLECKTARKMLSETMIRLGSLAYKRGQLFPLFDSDDAT